MACHVLRGSAGVHRADAIVLAGYGGEEAGTGLADVIFGRYVPAGRLPYTVPTGLEQLPPFESYQMDRGSCGDAACEDAGSREAHVFPTKIVYFDARECTKVNLLV